MVSASKSIIPTPPLSLVSTSNEPSSIQPDTTPNFTESDPLHPGNGYDFIIRPSTERARLRARTMIFDDISTIRSDSRSESENDDLSGKIIRSSGRRKKLMRRIKTELKFMKRKFEDRARHIQAVRRITLCRTFSKVRRGARSKLSQ